LSEPASPSAAPPTGYQPPEVLLRRYIGTPRQQVVTGVLVAALSVIPVEMRVFTGERFSIVDEFMITLLLLTGAAALGGLLGLELPGRLARWGWVEAMLLGRWEPGDILLGIRRSAYRFMLPHFACLVATRLAAVLLQLALPDRMNFSAMVVEWQDQGTGDPGRLLALFLLTSWSWLALAFTPIVFETGFWLASACLLHRRVGQQADDVAARLGKPITFVEALLTLPAILLLVLMAFSGVWAALLLGGLVVGALAGLSLSVTPVVGAFQAHFSDFRFAAIALLAGVTQIPALFFARHVAFGFACAESRRIWSLPRGGAR